MLLVIRSASWEVKLKNVLIVCLVLAFLRIMVNFCDFIVKFKVECLEEDKTVLD